MTLEEVSEYGYMGLGVRGSEGMGERVSGARGTWGQGIKTLQNLARGRT